MKPSVGPTLIKNQTLDLVKFHNTDLLKLRKASFKKLTSLFSIHATIRIFLSSLLPLICRSAGQLLDYHIFLLWAATYEKSLVFKIFSKKIAINYAYINWVNSSPD